jgi:tyrosine decarboxylase/aspartate 1-decarboxylase
MIHKVLKNLFGKQKRTISSVDKFSEKGKSPLTLRPIIASIINQYSERKVDGVGDLYNLPNKMAVSVWQKLLPFNPGYLGLLGASETEKNVIKAVIDLYHESPKKINGYITSGATEGNIYSCWLGRKYLEKYVKKEEICLLRTDLTHFSIHKGGDIIGVQDYIVGLNGKNWNMDINSLSVTIEDLYKKGYRGFIIPFTLGYTVGGTNDDFTEIAKYLTKIKKKFNIYFFTWIDAALSGLTYPFLTKNFNPFKNKIIKTIVVDFHKFAGVPFPAGVILYRREMETLIRKKIPYLKEKDDTLLGSRTGIPAVAIWVTIQSFGKVGFKKIIFDCLKRKNQFINMIKSQFPDVIIKTDSQSVHLAVIVRSALPKQFCEKYGLSLIKYKIKFKEKTNVLTIYKLFFLPKF